MSSETREAILVGLALAPWLVFVALIVGSAAFSWVEDRGPRRRPPRG